MLSSPRPGAQAKENSMSKTVGDFFVERLYDWGVRTIFGYPGDGINGVLGALQRAQAQDRIHPGAARGNGRLHGLGPRQVHRPARGLFVHRRPRRHSPRHRACTTRSSTTCRCWRSVGQAPRTIRGAHYQQEVNLERLFADVADYVQEAAVPSQVRHLVDRAMRTVAGPQRRQRAGAAERPAGRPTKNRRASTARYSPASATASRRSCPTRPTCAAPPRC
jgi:hypothetical protein